MRSIRIVVSVASEGKASLVSVAFTASSFQEQGHAALPCYVLMSVVRIS